MVKDYVQKASGKTIREVLSNIAKKVEKERKLSEENIEHLQNENQSSLNRFAEVKKSLTIDFLTKIKALEDVRISQLQDSLKNVIDEINKNKDFSQEDKTEEIENIKRDILWLKNTIEKNNEELTKQEKIRENILKRNEEVKKRIENQILSVRTLFNEKKSIQVELEEAEKRKKDLLNDSSIFSNQNDDLLQTIKKLDKQYGEEFESLQLFQKQIKMAEEDYNYLIKNLKQTNSEYDVLLTFSGIKNEQVQSLKMQRGKLEEILKNKKAEIEAIKREYEEIKAKYDEIKQQVDKSESLNIYCRELEEAISVLEKAIVIAQPIMEKKNKEPV